MREAFGALDLNLGEESPVKYFVLPSSIRMGPGLLQTMHGTQIYNEDEKLIHQILSHWKTTTTAALRD